MGRRLLIIKGMSMKKLFIISFFLFSSALFGMEPVRFEANANSEVDGYAQFFAIGFGIGAGKTLLVHPKREGLVATTLVEAASFGALLLPLAVTRQNKYQKAIALGLGQITGICSAVLVEAWICGNFTGMEPESENSSFCRAESD